MALINVPNSGQTLGGTRESINSNFSTINNAFAIDHVEMTAPGNVGTQGFHNKVTFPVQPSSYLFAAGLIGLYNLTDVTGNNELFINAQHFSGAVTFPMTASILSTSNPASLSSGWTYLPSGIILKWAANITATGAQNIVFPVSANIPAFTTCLTVLVSIADGGVGDVDEAIRITSANPTNFSVYASPRTTTGPKAVTFTYLAIGYK